MTGTFHAQQLPQKPSLQSQKTASDFCILSVDNDNDQLPPILLYVVFLLSMGITFCLHCPAQEM